MNKIEALKKELMAEVKAQINEGNFLNDSSSKYYECVKCEGISISIHHTDHFIITFSMHDSDAKDYFNKIKKSEIDLLIAERDRIDRQIKDLQNEQDNECLS